MAVWGIRTNKFLHYILFNLWKKLPKIAFNPFLINYAKNIKNININAKNNREILGRTGI
jgi:hypothetical protein